MKGAASAESKVSRLADIPTPRAGIGDTPLWGRLETVEGGPRGTFSCAPLARHMGQHPTPGPSSVGGLWPSQLNTRGHYILTVVPCVVSWSTEGHVAVTTETSSPLYLGGRLFSLHIYNCTDLQCGQHCRSTSFPAECSLLKPSGKSLLACKIVNLFCEMPLMKPSLSA